MCFVFAVTRKNRGFGFSVVDALCANGLTVNAINDMREQLLAHDPEIIDAVIINAIRLDDLAEEASA
jgi:hypothetical protein